MEAVIVAGGLGTRLWPLTVHLPKHLLPVAGVPFVAHQIAKLAAADVRRIVLATSYHADMFEPVLGTGSAWGVELIYVNEVEPLGTAGAIRNVSGHLESAGDDPVVILNGDILSGHDLGAQLDVHRRHQAEVTLHLVEVADARAYGSVPTDHHGNVTAFSEKSPDPVSRQINAGCYIFAAKVMDDIPANGVLSLERETFPRLLSEGRRVMGYPEAGYWLDVGTPQALCRGSADVVRGIVTTPAYRSPPAERWVAGDAAVSPDASVSGGSAVGPGARVGPGAILDGSLVCAGADVGAEAWVVDSVLGPGARLGRDVVVRDSVVGDRAYVGAGCVLVDGARVACDTAIAAGSIRFSTDV